MMTIDRVEQTIEKLTERIRSLSFDFVDDDLRSEAENVRDEAIEHLEAYLELVTQDWEGRPDSSPDDEP